MANQQLPPLVTTTPIEEYYSPTMGPPSTLDSRGRLRKHSPNPVHGRSVSAQLSTPSETYRYNQFNGDGSNTPSPMAPPAVFRGDLHPNSRSSSMDFDPNRSRPTTPTNYGSRPGTPTLNHPTQPSSRPSTPSGGKEKKKTGFFGKSKDKHEDVLPLVWVAGHPQRPAYDIPGLINGRPMPELWDDTDGNCLVYLFPRSSGKGPSFKIDSAVFASSHILTQLAFGELYSSQAFEAGGDRRQMPLDARTRDLSLHDPNTSPRSPRQRRAYGDSTTSPTSSHSSRASHNRLSNISDPPAETHLYLPVKLHNPDITQTPSRPVDGANDPALQDLQTLIDIRNFFAFLCGSSLVATERKGTFFHIFMTVSGTLKSYEFSNLDGSTFGEVPSSTFDQYVEELGMADVRMSREKTIEGIVLGERMKSVHLYNEAFTHGAGKHDDLVNVKSPKFGLMSSVTDNRLIRAAMDLDKRVASARLILNDFGFPALFTGIMASKTSSEKKEGVRFEGWKEGFLGFRKNYMSMLRHQYGDWPPKAKSKKNDLETSGLNRVVLRGLYKDMSSLYDLLVDRNSLTSRTVDGINLAGEREEPTIRALRAVLSEYDRSSPPVKPPIPFDLPILPKIRTIAPSFGQDKKKDIHLLQRKLKDDEISQILLQSWNKDALANPSPFLQAFWEMEKRAAHGCTIAELVDLRIGQWIFMYVVLQALPMLAVDAPGLKWTKGVEYFLCEPPRKGVPWANPNAPTPTGSGLASAGPLARTWFAVGEGQNVVSLPADVVEHGVEGIYRRSHCWVMAEKWASVNPVMSEALREQEALNAAAARYDEQLQQRPASRQRPVSANYTPTELSPPGTGYNGGRLSPGGTPGSRESKRYSSLGLGLEALPLPMGVTPDGSTPTGYQSPGGGTPGERPRSTVDASKTFDAILAGVDQEVKKGKRK